MRMCVVTTVERSAVETDAERALVARLLVDDADAWRDFDAKYSRVVLGCIHRVLSRFTRVTGPDDGCDDHYPGCRDHHV